MGFPLYSISNSIDEVVTSVPMWDRITVLRNRSWRQLVSTVAPNNAMFRLNNSLVGGITTAFFCIGVSKTQMTSVQYFIGIQVKPLPLAPPPCSARSGVLGALSSVKWFQGTIGYIAVTFVLGPARPLHLVSS
jgi:hypothetical protein